jgi:hypothetical protein
MSSELLSIHFRDFSEGELEVLARLSASSTMEDNNDIDINMQPIQNLGGFEPFADAINLQGRWRCENPDSTGRTAQPAWPRGHSGIGTPAPTTTPTDSPLIVAGASLTVRLVRFPVSALNWGGEVVCKENASVIGVVRGLYTREGSSEPKVVVDLGSDFGEQVVPCTVYKVLPETNSRDPMLGTTVGPYASGGTGSSRFDVDNPNWEADS